MNLVCIGGPLDGQVRPVSESWLEMDMVRFADQPKLPSVADLNLDAPLQQITLRTFDYKVGCLHFPGPWGTRRKIYYLCSPDLDDVDAIMRLLQHYAEQVGT